MSDPAKRRAAKQRYLRKKKIEKYGAEFADVNMRGRHGNHVRGEMHHRWNDRIIASTGYVKVRVGVGHHLADPNGYAYEHRLVAEEMLGRRLTSADVVHHRNEDKTDNRPENLDITSHSEHAKHHDAERERDGKGRFTSTGSVLAHRGKGGDAESIPADLLIREFPAA